MRTPGSMVGICRASWLNVSVMAALAPARAGWLEPGLIPTCRPCSGPDKASPYSGLRDEPIACLDRRHAQPDGEGRLHRGPLARDRSFSGAEDGTAAVRRRRSRDRQDRGGEGLERDARAQADPAAVLRGPR